MCKEYNGYANYQTWNVALWLDNDYPSYEYMRELASRADNAVDLADNIRDYVEDASPIRDANMFNDLIGHALASVDWYEIAENILKE